MSLLTAALPESVFSENQSNARLRSPSLDSDAPAAKGNRYQPARETSRPRDYAASVSAEAPLNRIGKCITVLLAEERTIVRQGIGALLAVKQDIAVVGQAPDCRQVLELAEQLRPDVVIIAISMALRNGLAALRRMLETRCGSRVLVLVPHNDNNAFAAHVAASGAAGCLTEQACSQSLATAVRKVHEKRKFFGVDGVRPAEAPLQPHHRGATALKDCTQLTTREWEVLQLIAEGNANKQTASKLSISIKTVEKHRQHLMDKLCLHDTASLTRYAVYSGIAQ